MCVSLCKNTGIRKAKLLHFISIFFSPPSHCFPARVNSYLPAIPTRATPLLSPPRPKLRELLHTCLSCLVRLSQQLSIHRRRHVLVGCCCCYPCRCLGLSSSSPFSALLLLFVPCRLSCFPSVYRKGRRRRRRE